MSLHATICRYDGVAGSIDEVMPAGRHLASELHQLPGFVAFVLVDAGHAALVSITVFEDRTDLEVADQHVQSWAAAHLAASLPHPPEAIAGEVIVQRGM